MGLFPLLAFNIVSIALNLRAFFTHFCAIQLEILLNKSENI